MADTAGPLSITDDGRTAGYITLGWSNNGLNSAINNGPEDKPIERQAEREETPETGTPLKTRSQIHQSHLQMKKIGAESGAWTTVYKGPDTATTLSGLENGEYQFRLQAGLNEWSPEFGVRIQHHSLTKAMIFFGMGFCMFIALLALLILSPRAEISNRA